ncbi:hypothetical protein SRB5_28310 [Streptomyces sp. RB5]|uniref:Class E sortase n=1 Tax=Streptomyces smaragdinus TaxID=2585196 RepID=A0A7K0CHA8_9ACTN|nr:class E sortase [Streptomyces smaragdinus]MQY12693.1 hypothetical protein [Streptomyces smaragdinus]
MTRDGTDGAPDADGPSPVRASWFEPRAPEPRPAAEPPVPRQATPVHPSAGVPWGEAAEPVPMPEPRPEPVRIPQPQPEPVRLPDPDPPTALLRPVPAPDPHDHPADRTMALRVAELRSAVAAKILGPAEDEPPLPDEPPPPGSRMAARQAARVAKQRRQLLVSRIAGEAFITFGALMLLFVAYQLWWTNVLADRNAGEQAKKLQEEWQDPGGGDDGAAAGTGAGSGKDRKQPAYEPGDGFAIVHIPKLGVDDPVAEGVDKVKVLDKGLIGHYNDGALKSAMPWDKTGNFAIAGHRNTHGEPFRYINHLTAGDKVVVETKNTYYVYKVTKQLPSTSPANTSVIDPVPKGSGFTAPGRYITLTTCTPEFTSKYRLIVWGVMVEELPRSEGTPDVLAE